MKRKVMPLRKAVSIAALRMANCGSKDIKFTVYSKHPNPKITDAHRSRQFMVKAKNITFDTLFNSLPPWAAKTYLTVYDQRKQSRP